MAAPPKIRRRKLSPRQMEKLSAILKQVGRQPIGIQFVSGDPEATQFAAQLISVFQSSGWTIEELSEVDRSNIGGLNFIVKSMKDAPTYTQLLHDTMTSLGIAATIMLDKKCEPKKIKLRVGHLLS